MGTKSSVYPDKDLQELTPDELHVEAQSALKGLGATPRPMLRLQHSTDKASAWSSVRMGAGLRARRQTTVEPMTNWPPYNIEKLDEDQYRITMAVAGFAPE